MKMQFTTLGFALGAILLTAATVVSANKDHHQSQHCTDVSDVGPVYAVNNTIEKCNWLKPPIELKCRNLTKTVHVWIPQLDCDTEVYSECIDSTTIIPYNVTKMVNNGTYVPTECKRLNYTKVHEYNETKCKNVTKEACTSSWIIDPITLQSVWERNFDCVNVTWIQCEPETKNKTITVPYTDCYERRDLARDIQTAEFRIVDFEALHIECTPQLKYNCSWDFVQVTRDNVPYRECWYEKEMDACIPLNVETYAQDPLHLVHCFSEPGAVIGTGVTPGPQRPPGEFDPSAQVAQAKLDLLIPDGVPQLSSSPSPVARAGNVLRDNLQVPAPGTQFGLDGVGVNLPNHPDPLAAAGAGLDVEIDNYDLAG